MAEGAFKVFIALHMADYASRHLLHFANVAGQAGKGVDDINKKLALMGGLGAMMVGGAVVGAMVQLTRNSVEAATELENVERKLRAISGINLDVFKNISKQGWGLGNQFQASTQAERLQTFGDLHTVFGNPNTAKQLWPAAMQFKMAMQAVNPEAGEKQFFAAFKAAELSTSGKGGHIMTPDAFQHKLDMFTKIYAGSMGRVAPTDLYAFTKQAKYSRFSLTDDAMYKAAALMYEQGGSITGSAYQALARVAGGKLGNSSSGATYAKEWEHMNLLTDITERSKQGNPKRFHVAGRDMLFTNPNKWAESVLLPAMQKKGFDINLKGPFLEELIRMFGNQTAGNAVFTMLQQRGILHKDAEIFKGSKGPAGLAKDYQGSYKGSFEAFTKSLTDLDAVIGKALKPVIVPGIQALTNLIRTLTAFAKDHPQIVRLVVVFTTLAGAALLIGGAILTVIALFSIALPSATAGGVAAVLALIGLITAAIVNPAGIMGAVSWLCNAIIGTIKFAAGMILSIGGAITLNKSLAAYGTAFGREGGIQSGIIPTANPSGHNSHITNHVNISVAGKDPEAFASAVKRALTNPMGGFTPTTTGGFKHAYGQ
jgi:hypothetical protein